MFTRDGAQMTKQPNGSPGEPLSLLSYFQCLSAVNTAASLKSLPRIGNNACRKSYIPGAPCSTCRTGEFISAAVMTASITLSRGPSLVTF